VEEIHRDFAAGGSLTDAALRQRDEMLACFQHFLGHDLHNTFLGVHGLARLLLTAGEAEIPAGMRSDLERITELLRLADEEARHLATLGRLIQDVGTPTSIQLSELCREAAAEARWLCGEPAVEYHISEHLPVANLPVRLVRTILVQVLRNAFGTGLSGRPLRVEIAGEKRAEEVVLRVVDDGRGLSLEQRHGLAKLLASGRSGTSGTGRGWFLVRHLLAASGGALRVRSAAGQGTAVTMTFRVPSTSS
jgi:signal transduction histidine kinase